MSQQKTALGVCLGAIALSLLFAIRAEAAEEFAVQEEAAAENLPAVTLSVQAVKEAAVAPYVLDEDEVPELPVMAVAVAPAVVANADLVSTCVADVELDKLVIFEPVFTLSVVLPAEEAIVGIASFYYDPQRTASGEEFDPEAFTAAAQTDLRDRFGGIRFGRLYQPAYALAEYAGKKLILKFNDVGPLRPGRKFDLSRAAMAYFDGLEKGLLPDLKVSPLPLGQIYPAGPVTDGQLATLGIEMAPELASETAGQATVAHSPDGTEPQAAGAAAAAPVGDFAPPVGSVATLADMQDG